MELPNRVSECACSWEKTLLRKMLTCAGNHERGGDRGPGRVHHPEGLAARELPQAVPQTLGGHEATHAAQEVQEHRD